MSIIWKNVYRESIKPWEGEPHRDFEVVASVEISGEAVSHSVAWPYAAFLFVGTPHIEVWNVSEMRKVADVEYTSAVTRVALLDGSSIVIASAEDEIVIYDITSGCPRHSIKKTGTDSAYIGCNNGFVIIVERVLNDDDGAQQTKVAILDVPTTTSGAPIVALSPITLPLKFKDVRLDGAPNGVEIDRYLSFVFINGARRTNSSAPWGCPEEDVCYALQLSRKHGHKKVENLGLLDCIVEDVRWEPSSSNLYILPQDDVVCVYHCGKEKEEPITTISMNSIMRENAQWSCFYRKNIVLILTWTSVGWNIDDNALWSVRIDLRDEDDLDAYASNAPKFVYVRPFGTIFTIAKGNHTDATHIIKGRVNWWRPLKVDE